MTDQCTEASLYWSTLRIPIYDNNHGFSLTDKRQGLNKASELELVNSQLQYVYSPSDRRTYYWQLPYQFLGNRLAAYGGNLTIFQQFSTRSQTGVPLRDSDVIMLGNGFSLHYNVPGERIPDQLERLKVPVYEEGWVVMRGNVKIPATRQDFLRVLSSIEAILVRATVCRDMERAAISRVNMDIAVGQETGGPPAVGAEECRCPAGYKGLSCEECSPGHYRDSGGRCLVCPCSGHEHHCSLNTGGGLQCACREGWTGPYCDRRGKSDITGDGVLDWAGLGWAVSWLHVLPDSRWDHHGAQSCLCLSLLSLLTHGTPQGHLHLQLHRQSETGY